MDAALVGTGRVQLFIDRTSGLLEELACARETPAPLAECSDRLHRFLDAAISARSAEATRRRQRFTSVAAIFALRSASASFASA